MSVSLSLDFLPHFNICLAGFALGILRFYFCFGYFHKWKGVVAPLWVRLFINTAAVLQFFFQYLLTILQVFLGKLKEDCLRLTSLSMTESLHTSRIMDHSEQAAMSRSKSKRSQFDRLVSIRFKCTKEKILF